MVCLLGMHRDQAASRVGYNRRARCIQRAHLLKHSLIALGYVLSQLVKGKTSRDREPREKRGETHANKHLKKMESKGCRSVVSMTGW